MVCLGLLVSFKHASLNEEVRQKGINALATCSRLYIDLKQFSVDVEYSVYYNTKDFSHPSETEKGRIIRENEQFYQENSNKITVLNRNYVVNIDKNSSVIAVADRGDDLLIPKHVNLDSLGHKVEDVREIERGYQYDLTAGQISQMDLILTTQGYLEKLRFHYRYPIDFGEGEMTAVTEIRYFNFTKNPAIHPHFFSEKKYVNILKTGEIVPVAKYKNYHVLNRLQ